MTTAATLARYAKFLATLPGLIGVIVSLNVLHGSALTYANAAAAAITSLLVVLVPNGDKPTPAQGDPAPEDVGPGTTVAAAPVTSPAA